VINLCSGLRTRLCSELSSPSDYFMSVMSIETIEQDEIDAVGYHVSVQTVYANKIAKFN
jgi:hypothetical protein